LRVLILHSLLACCVTSPFLDIVTRATTGERKPNGSLPKLRGVPYEFWGHKRNKIKNKIKLIPPEFDDKKRTHEALLQYSSYSTSETLVAAELCLFDSIQ